MWFSPRVLLSEFTFRNLLCDRLLTPGDDHVVGESGKRNNQLQILSYKPR